ncbi:expressed unknown protein [Seminavis robusta]|uniref:Uncharacterized protein n=1 Tax=Seminavis robusta TaxID=568900 RepID=A0A9N8HPK0_9STRA|nr:expressed unknown protein [Seminavis robusta]|eukprot:Sro1336_g263990.1 n/a (402) ;mRNA; r:4450-5655
MPHLHGNEATDSDTVSSVSACSKNINADQDDAECPVKAAESAANRLLSLAALAEEHGKCNVVVDVPAATRDETKEGSTVVDAAPASPPAVPPMHQHQHEEGREVPPAAPGMSPHWAMVGGHPPRFTGFFRQPGIHSVYAQGMAGAPSGVSPIPPEHSPRFMRRGAPRGGFPMWAGPPPPRPPYHPHPRAVGPSSLPPHFRRPIPPMFMARQCSANDEELERRSPAPKRVSLGYPPKSILKKPRLDPHATAVSPENCDESVEQDARPKSSLEALAESAAAISEASQRSQEESTTDEAKAAIESAAAVEKTAFSFSDDGSPKKQRIISPASSNEYPKAEYDDEMSYSVEGSLSPDHSRVMAGSPHRPYPSPGGPFRMGHMVLQCLHCDLVFTVHTWHTHTHMA